MTTCIATYRDYLLRGYTASPLDASIHFFAVIGNGMEWDENGDLVYPNGWKDTSPIEPKKFEAHVSGYEELDNHYRLEADANKIKYEWVDLHIDEILQGNYAARSYFKSDRRHGYYVVEGICLAYASALHFPDNIQPDWAAALEDFLPWWIYNLRCVWGIGHMGKTDFWTPKQKEGETAINVAYDRLYFIIHGRHRAESLAELVKLANEVMDELEAEEKQTCS